MLLPEEIKIVNDYCDKYITKKYRDDFKQHIYLCLLESSLLGELREREKIRNYIYKILKNQNHSKNSSFFYMYKKWDKNRQDIDDE